jgi:hypothetical protein
MTFTHDERRLLILYYSGSLADTADTLRLALPDITDPDERGTAAGALRKLEYIDDAPFQDFILESEGSYDG